MAKCTAWELQLIDPANNHDKFYRLYVVGAQWVAQFGRNGTVGQFQVRGSGSEKLAMHDALTQNDKKSAGGYDAVGNQVTFEIPNAYLAALKGHGQYLDAQFQGARGQRPTTPSAKASGERLAAKQAADVEAFKQTLLRMRDKARTPLPGRNPPVPEQVSGEIESPAVEVPTKSPIELALARALAAKKENA